MIIIFDFMRTLWDPEQQQLMPGTEALLSTLYHKHTLYLITRKEMGRDNAIQDSNINHFFSHILFTEGDKTIEDFEKVTQKNIPWQKKDVLVIGDRVRGEIAVGNSCGATTVWFQKGKFANELPRTKAENPDIIITDLLQLLHYILSSESV